MHFSRKPWGVRFAPLCVRSLHGQGEQHVGYAEIQSSEILSTIQRFSEKKRFEVPACLRQRYATDALLLGCKPGRLLPVLRQQYHRVTPNADRQQHSQPLECRTYLACMSLHCVNRLTGRTNPRRNIPPVWRRCSPLSSVCPLVLPFIFIKYDLFFFLIKGHVHCSATGMIS